MRFALIATSIAAVVAIPFALQASGSTMSREDFLSAVRCTALADATVAGAPDGAKWRLNAEARRQDAGTVAEARDEVVQIARQAVSGGAAADAAMVGREALAACSGAQLADGARGQGAV